MVGAFRIMRCGRCSFIAYPKVEIRYGRCLHVLVKEVA